MADDPRNTYGDPFPTEPPPPGPSGSSGNGSSGGGRYDRVPPHSLDAEVSVLGAAILSKNAAAEVMEIVKPEHFYRSAHGTIFEGIRDLFSTGEPIDAVTLLDWLQARNKLDEIGGASAIHDLTAAVPTAANAVYYARIVRDKALLRRLIDTGTEIVGLGYDGADDVQQTLDRAEAAVYAVAETSESRDYAPLNALLTESFERIEQLAQAGSEVTGLATGLDDLDRLTAGLQPQNLIIVAARPAMGKCLAAGSRVLLSDGSYVPIEDVVAKADATRGVLSLDDRGQLVAARPDEFLDNGLREVVRLRTRSGRVLVATPDHPMLGPSGWRHVADLRPGDLVATPRVLPVFGSDRMVDAEVVLLAYLIGDGCLTGRVPKLTASLDQVIHEATGAAAAFGCRVTVRAKAGTDAVELQFNRAHGRVVQQDVADAVGVSAHTVAAALKGEPGVAEVTRDRVRSAADDLHYTGEPQPDFLSGRLAELGLNGLDSHGKFVPEPIFRAPREQVAVFLSRLFATDGSAWVSSTHGYFGISYASVSERLIHDVQHLLLRFGVLSNVRERQVAYEGTRRQAFELEIRDAENVLRFLDEIGIFAKDEACERVRAAAEARQVRHTNTDLLPVEVWDAIVAEKGNRTWADVSAATGRPRNHNWHVGMRRPSRRLVAEIAEALDSARLRDAATSDVYWDEVVAIEPAGTARVLDLEVRPHHNFIADDVIVHNSSLSLGIAQYVTVELKKPAIIFSLEMSKLEIVQRMLSSEARVDSSKLRTGRLDPTDWTKLSDALGKLGDAPMFIDDTPSITLMEIRAKARRLKQKHGLELILVDYLQLMASHRRVDSRQQEVAEISRGLKMLAKELDVPVMALSQLSRNPEGRPDKRPQLSDLRESGSIEQDADIVGFIYRDEVYDEDSPDKGIAELIISKHRNGPTGTVRLAFLNHLTKFANLARGPGSGTPSGGYGGQPAPPSGSVV